MKAQTLHAGNPGPFTGDGNWTYLIDGAEPVLIDAGAGEASHLDAIDAAVGSRDLHLVVTHAHSDHIGGAPAVIERRPATRLSKMPWPERDRGLIWAPLQDGDVIATGEGALQVIHTPGHAPDHVCLWHADSRTLFVGDMLVQGTTVMIPASHGGSLAEYLRSLERLLALNPRRALPAHGPVIEDPHALIHYYVEHRADRERQVLDALEAGAATIDDFLPRIYPGLKPALEPMARETILAHLVKLESDGRVTRNEARWAQIDRGARVQAARRTALVVDDEESNAALVKRVLAAAGYEVESTTLSRVALAMIERSAYDAVIADVKMPEMSGQELYGRVCQLRPEMTRRFIFITGDIDGEDTRRFLTQTGCGYFLKPFNLEQLTAAVDTLTGARSNG